MYPHGVHPPGMEEQLNGAGTGVPYPTPGISVPKNSCPLLWTASQAEFPVSHPFVPTARRPVGSTLLLGFAPAYPNGLPLHCGIVLSGSRLKSCPCWGRSTGGAHLAGR